jgi:hypothetical protein
MESSLVHVSSYGTAHFIIVKDSVEDAQDYEFCADDVFKLTQEVEGPLSPLLVVLSAHYEPSLYDETSSRHSDSSNLAMALHARGVRCVVSNSTQVRSSIAEEIMVSFYR